MVDVLPKSIVEGCVNTYHLLELGAVLRFASLHVPVDCFLTTRVKAHGYCDGYYEERSPRVIGHFLTSKPSWKE
jgi:hypothetical protein